MVFVRDDVAESVTSYRIKRSISLNLFVFFDWEYGKILIEDFILFEDAIIGSIYQVISDFNDVIVVVNVASNKGVQTRLQPPNKQRILDLQLINCYAFPDIKNLEKEIVLLNGSILLKPLIKNDQLVRRLIYVEGFDTVACVLFFEAYLDVEVAEIWFNLGNVLGNDLILLVFLDLGEVEYLVTIFIKLTCGIADSLYLLEYYIIFYVVTLLDPIIEIISVSEKHL